MANAFVGTAEVLQLGDGNITDIDVSELLEDAPFLAAMAAIEASNENSHEWLKKTAAPAGGFRDINDGLEVTKATYTKVTEALKLFDASFDLDMGLLKLKSGDALRRREAKDHLKACFADMEKQIVYGTGQNSGGFAGLADETTLDDSDDPMVVNAGGTTADTASSVFAVRTNEEAVAIAYGANGRIEIGAEYKTLRSGSSTGNYDAVRTPIMFWGCLQIATSLDAGRICNLTEDSGKGLTDDLLSDLYSLFPANRKPNVFAMSRRSLKQLQQSRTATNPTGQPAPFPTSWSGGGNPIPIVATDQIVDTEALLTAA